MVTPEVRFPPFTNFATVIKGREGVSAHMHVHTGLCLCACIRMLRPTLVQVIFHTCTELNFALSILLSFILGVSFFSVTTVYYYPQLF